MSDETSTEINGARRRPVFLAILVMSHVSLPAQAMAENLSISVVDDSKRGVFSVIYQSGATEVIIGTTKEDGTLLVPYYNCNFDKPLLAKPISASYFNSSQVPCKTPLKFLVHSRMTPKGATAFSHIWKSLKFPDGSDGEIDYRLALNIVKSTVQLYPIHRTECKINYNIDGYGSAFKLGADSWTEIGQSQVLTTQIFTFDVENLSELFQKASVRVEGNRVETNDNGIIVSVPGDCSDVTKATTDVFADVIKGAVDQKVRMGEYRDPKDLFQRQFTWFTKTEAEEGGKQELRLCYRKTIPGELKPTRLRAVISTSYTVDDMLSSISHPPVNLQLVASPVSLSGGDDECEGYFDLSEIILENAAIREVYHPNRVTFKIDFIATLSDGTSLPAKRIVLEK